MAPRRRSRTGLIIGSLLLTTALWARAQEAPFDAMQKSCAPFIATGDPLGYPLKVLSVSSDSYKFWRGTKDLFYVWCKTHTADWLADKNGYVISHGDLHIGNMGTFACGETMGTLAVGEVDFDESARLPFQLELVQGFVTMRLVVRKNQVLLSDAQQQAICEAMTDAYRDALKSDANATKLLDADPTIAAMLARSTKKYKKEISEYVKDGRFVESTIDDKTGLVKDILRRTNLSHDDVATAIAQAIAHAPPRAASIFRETSAGKIAKSIEDIAQRTRTGSSGSQGLKKYFILLKDPLRDYDNDAIVYFKQQIPTAAERAGIIPRDPRNCAERCAQDMAQLTNPPPYFNSWCEMKGESYWVTIKEPWSDEFNPDDFATNEDLLRIAKIWGTIAGASHHTEPRRNPIAASFTPELTTLVRDRATTYLNQLEIDFTNFTRDPRTADLRKSANDAIAKIAQPSKP